MAQLPLGRGSPSAVDALLDILGLFIFYILKQDDTVIYYGITDRDIEERLTEHIRDGKIFNNVSYLDDLPDRISARDLEGSALHNARGNRQITNATRLDGGFYHSYDPDNLKPGRHYYSDGQIAEKLRDAKNYSVDKKGKLKVCHG